MKRKLLLTLGCLVGLATLSYGGYAWYNAITYVSTDDAYVEGTISPVSAKVAGHIVELFVQDNQVVKKGELLMRVDPRDFQAKRDQARAAVATADANPRAAPRGRRGRVGPRDRRGHGRGLAAPDGAVGAGNPAGGSRARQPRPRRGPGAAARRGGARRAGAGGKSDPSSRDQGR